MKEEVIAYIDSALLELNLYIDKYQRDKESFSKFFVVLSTVKDELNSFSEIRNIRLLRGVKDLCTNCVRNYESEKFCDILIAISEIFAKEIPGYSELELLRMDFGKGDPI